MSLIAISLISLDKNGNEDDCFRIIFIAMSYAHTRIIDRFQEEAEYNNTICGIHGKQIKNIIERSLRDCIDYEGTHPYQDKKEFAYSVELIRKTNEKISVSKRYRIAAISSDFRNIELVQPPKKTEQKWYDWITRLLKK